jgi:hypothetical protein
LHDDDHEDTDDHKHNGAEGAHHHLGKGITVYPPKATTEREPADDESNGHTP